MTCRMKNHLGKQRDASSAPRESASSGFPHKRILARMGIVLVAVLAARFFLGDPETSHVIARSYERHDKIRYSVMCMPGYGAVPGCSPKSCGRVVMDNLVTGKQVKSLLGLSNNARNLLSSNNQSFVWRLDTGILYYNDTTLDINHFSNEDDYSLFSEADSNSIRSLVQTLRDAIAKDLKLGAGLPYLTSPAYYVHATSQHTGALRNFVGIHADRVIHPSYTYTVVLDTGTYRQSFHGGRLVFVDKGQNSTVEPRPGRVTMFTSGSENHYTLERVTSGARRVFIFGFTCDEEKKIDLTLQHHHHHQP